MFFHLRYCNLHILIIDTSSLSENLEDYFPLYNRHNDVCSIIQIFNYTLVCPCLQMDHFVDPLVGTQSEQQEVVNSDSMI